MILSCNTILAITGILKVGVETLNLLASATLAMQTTVLAASLFQKLPEHAENEQDKSMFRKKNNSGAPQVLGQNLGVKREVVETRALTKSNVQDVQMFRFSDPKVNSILIRFISPLVRLNRIIMIPL